MANVLIPSFVDLPADVFSYIFSYLDVEDMIAFALTCQIFRQMCVDAKVFRKMDLSRHPASTMQRGDIDKFLRDRPLTQHIRELNISNLRVLNWQMDNQLEEFVVSICPHLEALHVVNCGLSLQRLHCILEQAPKLMALSWSLWNVTSQDIQFLSESMKSSHGICLKNIKHLHLEMNESLSHIQIAKYLLITWFRDLEELEIYTWLIDKEYFTGQSFPLPEYQMIPVFSQPSVDTELQILHSLVVVAVGGPVSAKYKEELSDFVVSVLSRKSSSTKWKKFWISPTFGIHTKHLTNLSHLLHKHDFQSVEAITANPGWSLRESANAVDEVTSLFERIGDNAVRSLHFRLPNKSIVEFREPILRVGGHSLKFLHLSVHFSVRLRYQMHPDQNVSIHSLLSNCSNIVELDLLYCSFEKDICEPLSKLKHLSKVQLRQCAISSKYNENQVEILKADLLTFVKNCKSIMHFDVRGCHDYHMNFSCRLTDDDLTALAELRNLTSLTLYNISGISKWTFLQNISERCKFLTTLRIYSFREHFKNCQIQILMESSRFLEHLAISVDVPILGSEVFWSLLSQATNLQRLCIKSIFGESLNVPVAVETLKSLPRLYVLHLHNYFKENVEDFCNQMIRMLQKKESDYKFSFEIVTGNRSNMLGYRKDTWINHHTGYTLISNKALPLNEAELCLMTPVLDIPRF